MASRAVVTIKWERKAKFVATIEKYERRYINEIKRIIKKTAEMIELEAKLHAPYDNGYLLGSIGVVYYNDGLTAKITVGEEYGIYVEFGTGIYARDGDGRKTPWVYYKNGRYYWTQGNRPQPFFYPAVEQAARFFKRELNRLG